METTIFEVKLKDGRTFRIFCANSTQKRKFILSLNEIEMLEPKVSEITNGIHTMKQWNNHVYYLKRNG